MSSSTIGAEAAKLAGLHIDLSQKIRNGNVTLEELERFLFLSRDDRSRLFGTGDNLGGVESKLEIWRDFYRKHFGIELDTGSIRVPEHRPGFDRLIVVAEGLTPNRVYDACAEQFPCWRWTDDLDKAIVHNDREPTQMYAVWVRDRKEADEELANRPANNLKSDGISGMTLLERLIHELKYFNETGKHLDVNNITLCSGSRDSDGYVPNVHWSGWLKVDGYYPANRDDDLRAREVVS